MSSSASASASNKNNGTSSLSSSGQGVDDNMIRDTKRRKDNEGSAISTATTELDMQSDVDDVVSDLIKEELQLVVTRLLKASPGVESTLKKEALRVINARAKQSAAPQSKQLQMMQKLLQQHSTMAMAMSQGGDAMDATQPMGMMSQGMDGLPIFGGGISGGGDFVAAFMGDPVAMIRRKIREAFRPDNKMASKKRDRLGDDAKITYRIDAMIVRTELEQAKDMILNKNEQRQGLSHMEAITQEFSDRGAEIGVSNITGYVEMLQQIASDWVEIFLFEELDMDATERDEWDKKLGEMDNSPNEEEGVFTVARYAARLGWSNQHLKNVLLGESIGKFKEPQELSIARLNHLERQKRYEDGVNLAKAVDLDFYAAKFLLRIGRLSEVEDTVKSLEDAERLFSLAQVARALDVTVSFNLALQSIAVTGTWNNDNTDRATWICDLCISQKMLETLVEQLESKVHHKDIQFQIAKILKEKEQHKYSLEICKYTIKPVKTNAIDIHNQQDALKKQNDQIVDSQQKNAVGVSPVSSSSSAVASPTLLTGVQGQEQQQQQQQLDAIVEVDEGEIVPRGLSLWMWTLVHEMLLLELTTESDMRGVVEYIANTVTDIAQLLHLMQDMNNKNEFDLVVDVAHRTFAHIQEQQQREQQLQMELIKNQLEAQYAAQDLNADLASDPEAAQRALNTVLSSLNQTINFQKNAIHDEVAFEELLKLVQERKATDIVIIDRNSITQQQQYLQQNLLQPSSILSNLSVGRNPFGTTGRKLISVGYVEQWDSWRYKVAVQMTDSALESNNPMLQNAQMVQQQQASRMGVALTQAMQAQQKQFRLPKPVPRSKIEQVVNHCLDQLTTINHFSWYQKHLHEKQEYDLSIHAGFRAQDCAKELAQQKNKRDEKMTTLNELRLEEQQAVQNKRTFRLEKRIRLRELEHQQKLYLLQSPTTNQTPRQYETFHHDVASLTFRSMFSSRISPDTSKQMSKERVQEIAEKTITFLHQPSHYETLTRVCLEYNEYDFCVFIARAGHKVISEMEQKKLEREKIRVPLQILREEQNRLIALKQQLPSQKQHELTQLERQFDALPELNASDEDSVDGYNSRHSNLSSQAIISAIRGAEILSVSTSRFEGRLAAQQQYQQQLQGHEPFSSEKTREIVLESFSHVKSPASYNQLLALVAQYDFDSRIELVMELGGRIQAEIAKLVEERKSQQMPALRYAALVQQKQQLEASKKFLKPEQLQELSKMEHEQRLLQVMRPSWLTHNLTALGDVNAKIVANNRVIDTILTKRNSVKEELKELMDEKLRRVADNDDQQMTDDAEDEEELALERKKEEEKQEELEKAITTLQQQLSTSVRSHLQFVLNPNDRHAISKKLSTNKEFDLAIEVCKSVQSRINEVIQEKKERDIWLNELADLEEEERQLQEQRKQSSKRRKLDATKQQRLEELRMQRDYRSIFPAYLSSSEVEFAAMHLRNSESMINACASKKEEEKNRLDLDLEMSDEQKQEVMDQHDKEIHKIVDICLEYVKAPEHLIQLMAQNANNLSLMLRLGKVVLERTKFCIEKRHELNTPEQMVIILEKEQQDLVLLRKTLPENLEKILAESVEKVNHSDLPTYITNHSISDMQHWKNEALKKMLDRVLRMKSELENRMAADQSLTAEQIEQENDRISELFDQVVSLIQNPLLGLEDPSHLLGVAKRLQENRVHKLAISIGNWAYEKLAQLRQLEEKRQLPEQQYALLSQESANLLNQRKQLSEDQQTELRDLKLQHALLQLQPAYVRKTQAEYDRIAFQVSSVSIAAALGSKNVLEDKMDMAESQMEDAAMEEQISSAQKDLENVVDKTVENIFIVENLIRVTLDLSEKLEYALVLRVGGNVVKRIGELRVQVEEIKSLEQEKEELQKKFRLQRDDATQQRLNDIEARLQQLPLKYQNTALIDMLMLKTAKVMNQAAKIEERNDVQLEMSIATFKIKPSVVLFGEIQLLCDENVWTTTLRKELLDHVLQILRSLFENKGSNDANTSIDLDDDLYYSDDDDDEGDDQGGYGYRSGKKKNNNKKKTMLSSSETAGNSVKNCIELLLNEGYWQEVTKIFPRPSEAGTSSVELLERLWVELNNNAPAQIPGILPLAEEYITHCFLLYEFDIVNDLLDLLENHDVDVAAAIYEKCAEKMGLNISPKQYKTFASSFLPLVKGRFQAHGRTDLWDEFFDKVNKANKSKKKLMQMIETEGLNR